MKKPTKPLLAIIPLIFLFFACDDGEGNESKEGSLRVSLSAISIDAVVANRTAEVNIEDFKLTIFNRDGSEYAVFEPIGTSLNESIGLPIGEYYIEAHSNNGGDENVGFDLPFYYGISENFNINGGIEEVVTVDLELANTQVSITWSEQVQTNFSSYHAVVTDDITSNSLTFEADETRYGFFLAGNSLSIKVVLAYGNAGGSTIESVFSATISDPLAKTRYEINVDPGDGSGAIFLNVDETVDLVELDITSEDVEEPSDVSFVNGTFDDYGLFAETDDQSVYQQNNNDWEPGCDEWTTPGCGSEGFRVGGMTHSGTVLNDGTQTNGLKFGHEVKRGMIQTIEVEIGKTYTVSLDVSTEIITVPEVSILDMYLFSEPITSEEELTDNLYNSVSAMSSEDANKLDFITYSMEFTATTMNLTFFAIATEASFDGSTEVWVDNAVITENEE